jgi:hypothetical protein
MANQRRKQEKGRNGVSVTVFFDQSDPAERKALEAARLLAAKHGRRKQAIIALLEAVYTCYEQTGELMSASAISAALIGQGAASGSGIGSYTRSADDGHGSQFDVGTIPQPKPSRKRRRSESIEVTSSGKASAETVARNFLTSMKTLASGFFD